jgi:enoyl-CoA hydratase/carnithine racemase
MEAMLLTEKIDMRQAREWGLIDRIVSDTTVVDAKTKLASRAAEGPTYAQSSAASCVVRARRKGW